ncbi:hypothetical protein DESPIGER_2277 [Desulfovibrio piger]|uniref:Uncharacterized protein n=1 Tax=Desulfovibrio piger TaxID=901 RepID=A0A1K1LHD0_9BACT|nr:hypothetical protein DESPIGER_2277 [Desulfovibrio piger]
MKYGSGGPPPPVRPPGQPRPDRRPPSRGRGGDDVRSGRRTSRGRVPRRP